VPVVLCCRRADGSRREVRLTGQKSAEVVVPAGIGLVAGKGRTSGEAEESVLLMPVALIAAIPRTRASCREETVSSVEHHS
jgi:hypothetical protein